VSPCPASSLPSSTERLRCLARHAALGPTIWAPREGASQLSYVRGRTDAPLLNVTIGTLLERQALAFPAVEALVSLHQGTRLTYAELARQSDEVARGLLTLGVQVCGRGGEGGRGHLLLTRAWLDVKHLWVTSTCLTSLALPLASSLLAAAGPHRHLGPQLCRVDGASVRCGQSAERGCGREGRRSSTTLQGCPARRKPQPGPACAGRGPRRWAPSSSTSIPR
jgi:non-ribosomal peptide synthetase component F